MESDEEGDFRRRDKFYAERHQDRYQDNESSQYKQESRNFWKFPRPGPGPSHGYPSHHRGQPRGYDYPPPDMEWPDMGKHGQRGHAMPPPSKRMRSNIESDEQEGFRSSRQLQSADKKLERTIGSKTGNDGFQPLKMTFKAFLSTQDDSITDEEAAQKYGEYKMEFRRQQLNEFFSCHKESEWFRIKYHPEESKKRKDLISAGIKKRMEAYQALMKDGLLDSKSVNTMKEKELMKILDQAVILFEGGSKEDLENLSNFESESAKDETVADSQAKEKDLENADSKCLHKTTSVFLKSLPANITSSELETVCKRYPGFLRICISDPDPAKKWTRRGWVTFARETKIKEICFNLNNVRIRGCELSPVVNKDLSKRIREVAAICNDVKVARNDTKLAAKIISNLDARAGFYMTSANPLLASVQDYLIEEVSAEEDELLGLHKTQEKGAETEEKKEVIQENAKLLEVLDKLILYLRIVHSVDYYNCLQYPFEDEMPNRCGIFHVRSETKQEMVGVSEIEDHNKNMEKKLKPLLDIKSDLTEEEANKLGE